MDTVTVDAYSLINSCCLENVFLTVSVVWSIMIGCELNDP